MGSWQLYKNAILQFENWEDKEFQLIIKGLEGIKTHHMVLDLGGGTGLYGSHICDLIKGKKSICYDSSEDMLSIAKDFPNVEIVNNDMEFALKNEKEKGNIFSVILFKGSFHFNQKSFLEKLEDFMKTNLDGKLMIVGRLNPVDMEEELPFPKKALEKWNNYPMSIKDALEYFKNRNYETTWSMTRIYLNYSYDQFRTFFTKKCWSIFQDMSDEELESEFLRIIGDKKEIGYNDDVYMLTVESKLNNWI